MLALLLTAALLTAGPAWRRGLGLALALVAAACPLFLDGPPLLRGLAATATFWAAARILDLAREGRPLGPGKRLAHTVALIDIRSLQPVAPWFDRRAWVRLPVWLAAAMLALHGATHTAILPLRWALGALFVYTLAESANSLAHAVLAAVGQRSPPLHRTPIAACSLKEFWGERWNLPVSRWLRAHFFMPQARRRRPRLGLALAFLASAGLHAWIVAVAVGPAMAAIMASYFVVQGLLLALEVRLGVARWTEAAGWAWTMACVLVPSPLFIEPLLRVVEPARALLALHV